MTPYYADDFVTLYHGDCRDVLEWTDADILITDPPYGMNFRSGYWPDDFSVVGDGTTEARDAVLARWGVERPWAVFGTWRVRRPPHTCNVLVWDKTEGTGPGMGDLSQAFGFSHEEIYLGGQWPKGASVRHGSVLRTTEGIRALAVKVGHPTPKPVSLLERIVRAAPPGVIADPFAGTGSTLVAAKRLGRRAVGVEISEKYCGVASELLSQNVLDLGGAA